MLILYKIINLGKLKLFKNIGDKLTQKKKQDNFCFEQKRKMYIDIRKKVLLLIHWSGKGEFKTYFNCQVVNLIY